LWFPTGVAYTTDREPPVGQNEARQVVVHPQTDDVEPVAKTWVATPGGTMLVEGLQWQNVQPKFAALPNFTPSDLAQGSTRLELLNQLPDPNPGSGSPGIITTATVDYRPTGIVLDPSYVTVTNSYAGAYSFDTGVTYFVNSSTYFGG